MRRARGDSAVSSVIGAIVILAILGLSLAYVNAFHVPRKGMALEMDAREDAEAALSNLAADLDAASDAGALVADVPLRAPSSDPPLLGGIVLTPVRSAGALAFEPAATRITLRHATVPPPGGVPANDPLRQALPNGLMSVYTVGNATSGRALGALDLDAGAAYLEDVTYRLEGGALVAKRSSGSALLSPPSLVVGAGGTPSEPTTTVTWRIPFLAGAASEISGGERAQITLTPGPAASIGGGQLVHNVTLVVETDALAAWRAALEEVVGSRGTVTATATGVDRGSVTAIILPPAGTTTGRAAVELRLQAVRYDVGLAERGAG